MDHVSDLRNAKAIAKKQARVADIARAQKLKTEGMSNAAIAKQMNISESTVRSLLAANPS